MTTPKSTEMRKEEKYFYPLRKAIYSIQFWYNEKEKVLEMTETANKSDKLHDNMSMYHIGYQLAKSKFLDKEDKECFKSFCNGFISKFENP
jgi:hypothetical protein